MEWMRVDEWLQAVKEVLIQEGFQGTILQTMKPGQVFGLVRKLDNVWEMHVRGFSDGLLESEIEISRDYLEHFNQRYRRDATSELMEILEAYQIPCTITGSLPQMTVELYPPKKLTPWKPIVGISALVAFLYWLGRNKD